MKIDKTTTVTGGGLFNLDIEVEDIIAVLDPPSELTAVVDPTTVSISHMSIGSEDPGVPVDPDPEEYPYYGMPSRHFGLGGAPPYIDGYPVGGAFFSSLQGLTPVTEGEYTYDGIPTIYRGFGLYPTGGLDFEGTP